MEIFERISTLIPKSIRINSSTVICTSENFMMIALILFDLSSEQTNKPKAKLTYTHTKKYITSLTVFGHNYKV